MPMAWPHHTTAQYYVEDAVVRAGPWPGAAGVPRLNKSISHSAATRIGLSRYPIRQLTSGPAGRQAGSLKPGDASGHHHRTAICCARKDPEGTQSLGGPDQVCCSSAAASCQSPLLPPCLTSAAPHLTLLTLPGFFSSSRHSCPGHQPCAFSLSTRARALAVLARILDGRTCSGILAGNAQSAWSIYLPVSMEISAACIAFSRAAGTRETMEARTGLEAMSPPAEASPLRAILPLDALLSSLVAGLRRIITARFGLVMEDQTLTTCQRYATSNPPVHEPGSLPSPRQSSVLL